MKILHLCSDYPFTDVYRELISVLDNSGINQIIYIPLKRESDIGKRIDTSLKNTKYIYSKTFRNIDRFFYYHKVNKILKDLKVKVNLCTIDLIHAHFLFSLGGIAMKLKQEMGIDYIASVRNADVNYFFKYGLWLRKQGVSIMQEARNVIFISPAYEKKVFRKYVPVKLQWDIKKKCTVLPNGVNSFWIKNKVYSSKALNKPEIKLIFVGELKRNKNIETSINVTKNLIGKEYKATLKIVGAGPEEKKIKVLANKNKAIVHFCGYIANKDELIKLYGESDIFIMPSFTETFGIVYIEAMSQGLPVIYSRGEGIDGLFRDGEVGFAVNPVDVGDIVERIEDIYLNYEKISKKCTEVAADFSWRRIGKDYIKLVHEK